MASRLRNRPTATAALNHRITIAEYLSTTYRPDCDYIDGEVLERHVGEKPHGLMQGMLCTIFMANEEDWNLLALISQRVQTSETHFRIPDLCLVEPTDSDNILRNPPILCVEILSKDDTLRSMQERIDDYQQMGVANIWVIDPVLQRAWFVSPAGLQNADGKLTIPGSKVTIDLAQLFRRFEDRMAGRLGIR